MSELAAAPLANPTVVRLLFLNAQKSVQTLAGRSSRKTFIASSAPAVREWATGLLGVQRANFGRSFESTAFAEEPLALYNTVIEPEPADAKVAVAAGLLSEGKADPNSECELHPKFGTTPIMEAAFHGHTETLKLFIEHNGDMNTASGFGWTALHYAGEANNAGCVEVLLAAGADASMKNAKGKTAKMRAVEAGTKQEVLDVFERFV